LPIGAIALNYRRIYSNLKAKPREEWHCPPEGMYIIDVDASFNPDTKKNAIGVFIRDSRGGLVADRIYKIDMPFMC
jgi:hypothetical protein